jgi:hypothetical protein
MSIASRGRDTFLNPVREDIGVERQGFLLRRQIQLAPEHLLADVKLSYRLVAAPHPRIETHETAMALFPGRVLLKHLSEAIGRLSVCAVLLERLSQPQQQPNAQFGQEATTFRAPILVAILGQEVTAVSRQRSVIRSRVPILERTLSERLEAICIDPDMRRVQREHGVCHAQVRGAAPGE